jgi:hypothetical protein
MQGTRKIESCLNCGEEREIAAHGLCFRCYLRNERAEERKFAYVEFSEVIRNGANGCAHQTQKRRIEDGRF